MSTIRTLFISVTSGFCTIIAGFYSYVAHYLLNSSLYCYGWCYAEKITDSSFVENKESTSSLGLYLMFSFTDFMT